MGKLCHLCKRAFEKGSSRSYHVFPRDIAERREWFRILRMEVCWIRHIYLCSDHFTEADFYYQPRGRRTLKKGAKPIMQEDVDELNSSSSSSSSTLTASSPKSVETIIPLEPDPQQIEQLPAPEPWVFTLPLATALSTTQSAEAMEFQIEKSETVDTELEIPPSPASSTTKSAESEECQREDCGILEDPLIAPPRERMTILKWTHQKVLEQRKKIRTIQQQCRRLKARIGCFKSLVKHLTRQNKKTESTELTIDNRLTMEANKQSTRTLNKEDFGKVCRSCLLQGPMASIFELKYENYSFSDILLRLFSVQVKPGDNKPQNICETCIAEVIRFYNFKRIFIASEEFFQSILGENVNVRNNQPIFESNRIKLEECDADDSISICEHSLEDSNSPPLCDHSPEVSETITTCDHNPEVVNSSITTCDDIPEVINTITIGDDDSEDDLIEIIEDPCIEENYDLSDEKSINHDPILKLYSSEEEEEIQIDCITTENLENVEDFFIESSQSEGPKKDSYLEIVDNGNIHIRRVCNGVKKRISTPKVTKGRIYTCSCQKTFESQSDYIKHRKDENHPRPRNHTCKICNKTFNRNSLQQHMRRHTKEKPYECKVCFDKFSLSGNLRRHMMRHTGERPHVCEFCGKGFIQGPSLTAHKRIHTGEKPFLCNYCGKSYSSNLVYKFHLHKHAEENDEKSEQPQNGGYRCKFCDKVFNTNTILKTHLLRHGEKRFLCSRCGKGFYTKGALQSHSTVHTGVRPFSCNICYRKFSQRSSLKTHMYTHTGDKPYVCNICSKAFTQVPHLKTHLRTHSGERPYICSFCHKSFPHSGTLQVHVRTHTGETPYMCDQCPRGFYDSSSLKRHRRRHLEETVFEEEPV